MSSVSNTANLLREQEVPTLVCPKITSVTENVNSVADLFIRNRPVKQLLPVDLKVISQLSIPELMIEETSCGTIQFGCPPESAKKWMREKKDVPTTYVLPDPLFKEGINYGDVEFPIYWYSFVKKWLVEGKRISLIGTADQISRLKIILKETIFGPDHEFLIKAGCTPKEIQRIERECGYFAVKDNKGAPYPLESFVNFIPFDSFGYAYLDEQKSVSVLNKGSNKFLIQDKSKEKEVVFKYSTQKIKLINEDLFSRPNFGVTFLGTSSGFDPVGLTTSFIIWMNGKGLLVDPLAYSQNHLESIGIANEEVTDVLLTHVHGDHDPGLIEFILSRKMTRMLTSRVIYESFLRKSYAITDQNLSDKIEFIELIVGEKFQYINGFTITSRNNFHSIPTIGIFVESPYGSFGYSGDTFFEHNRIEELVTKGVLTRERADEIQIYDADFNFHEAGIEPIHTPIRPLISNSVQKIKNLTFVHCCQPKEGEDIPVAKSGEHIIFKG